MTEDKYSALWLSYSAIMDYLACPRSYYLKYIYRHPDTGNRVQIATPALSLGSAVHEVLEELSHMPTHDRFKQSLLERYHQIWMHYSGKRGGFVSFGTEKKYKEIGETMLSNIEKHPGPLKNQAVKIKMEIPYFWLSKTDNIILSGKIDWLEYLPKIDAVHIIDFKTGQREEKPTSLQLPIYYLLAQRCQHRPVSQMSYWYLRKDPQPKTQVLPDQDKVLKKLLQIGIRIKTAKQLNTFKCEHQGCTYCHPYELIKKGQAEFIGTNSRNQDIYLIGETIKKEESSIIL